MLNVTFGCFDFSVPLHPLTAELIQSFSQFFFISKFVSSCHSSPNLARKLKFGMYLVLALVPDVPFSFLAV